MKWEEFVNNDCIIDEEAIYDGWNEINLFGSYRIRLAGTQLGYVGRDKLADDEAFNIELKSSFPNLVLIDGYERKKDKMKFFCETCKNRFVKTGITVLLSGCPYCNRYKYKGEMLLCEILTKKKINYTMQFSYGCINPETGHELYYDFVIENGNELIFVEIQGAQYYQPVDFFGGEDAYEKRIYRDEIKRNFAYENGIYVALDYREHNLKLLEERIYEQLMPLLKF